MSAGPTASAADRLSRLLAMVPWLLGHQGVALADAARHFAITEDQLVRDLELLFVCGTPGHMPDDLIEAEWDSGRVYLGNADAIARPLRLALDEALALLAGLRTLMDVPGLELPAGSEGATTATGAPGGAAHDTAGTEAVGDGGSGDGGSGDGGAGEGAVVDRDALTGALTKLSAAAGEAAAVAGAVRVDLSGTVAGPVAAGGPAGGDVAPLAVARRALRGGRRMHLSYLVPTRDETTERDVDPMRVLAVDGHWYLEGWCHRADGVRMFRLDRVLAARVLDVDGTPPPEAVSRDVDDGLFRPSPDDLLVTLDLAPRARWIAEHYPVQDSEPLPGDGLRVRLRTADPRWLWRLVLGQGGAAVVVHPADLARQVADVAARALAAYDEDPAAPAGTAPLVTG